MKAFSFRDVGFMGRVQATQVVATTAVLLLRGQGANGSTVITDDAPSPHTVTAINGSTISTAQFKFGSSSLYFPGSNNGRVIVADRSDLNLGNSDFTLEGWIRPSVSGAFQTIVTKRINNSANASFLVILFNDNTLRLFVSSDNMGWNVFNGNSFGAITINAWNHFALARSGSNWYLSVGGVLGATLTSAAVIGSTSTPLLFGADSDALNFNGHGHFRLTATALYTTTFTPPASW